MSVSRRNFLKGGCRGLGRHGADRRSTDRRGPAQTAAPMPRPAHVRDLIRSMALIRLGVLTPGPAASRPFACFAAFDSHRPRGRFRSGRT